MFSIAQGEGPSCLVLGVEPSGSLHFLNETQKLGLSAETKVVWGSIHGNQCHLAGLVLLVLGKRSIQAVSVP